MDHDLELGLVAVIAGGFGLACGVGWWAPTQDAVAFSNWWTYVVGFGFSVFAPLLVRMRNIQDHLFFYLGGTKADQESELPQLVGILKRLIYTAAMLATAPEVIAAWLVLKVAGSWKGWAEVYETQDGKKINGRLLFQTFLIGTVHSLAYGIVGAKIIQWLIGGHPTTSFAIAALLVCASFALLGWSRHLHHRCRRQ